MGLASSWAWPRPLHWKSIIFTKIRLKLSTSEILQFSLQFSITIFQGFLLRYITFFYVNWLKNSSLSKFEKFEKGPIYLIKKTFFKHFELCQVTILEPVDLQKYCIPQKKVLKHSYWCLYWKLEYLWCARLQPNFNENNFFSIKWACSSWEWC